MLDLPKAEKIKILLVSDSTRFALTDVYYGYCQAFRQLGIEHDTYPFHRFLDILAPEICYQQMHSRALVKKAGFTHVMFIGGLNIPPDLLDSFYHVKTVVIATEDPHTFDPMRDRLGRLDYYFTNEQSVASCGRWKNVWYCPTAADLSSCGRMPSASIGMQHKSDICFLGAMYPNRRTMLEAILPAVKANGWNLKILGHPQFLPKDSPLWEYVPPENYDSSGVIKTIEHNETIKYYNGAKVVLNFFRDTSWHPKAEGEKNTLNSEGFVAESLNPRAYEVAACGAFQLLEDSRKEARSVFQEDEVGFFSDEGGLVAGLSKFLSPENEGLRASMANKSMVKVGTQHSYVNRLKLVLDVLRR